VEQGLKTGFAPWLGKIRGPHSEQKGKHYEVTATGELVTVPRHAMIIEHLARRILKVVGLPWMGKDP